MDGGSQRMRPGAPCRNRRTGIRRSGRVAPRSGSPYTYPSDEPALESMAADHSPPLAILCFPSPP